MNEYEQKPANLLTIPVAIVVAGALIAVSVIYTSAPRTAPTSKTNSASANIISALPIEEKDHILGNPSAPIVIIEYSDTECPFCKNFHSTMHRIIDKYGKDGKVAWVYRHLPISNLHPKAWNESIATECAAIAGNGSASFWKYIDKVYEVTPSNNKLEASKLIDIARTQGLDMARFQSCLDKKETNDRVTRDYDDGVALNQGRPGTPTNVFVLDSALSSDKRLALSKIVANEGLEAYITISDDGKSILVKGAFPYEIMALMIDLLLQ
ncbi:MAG: thioredoxin domain-containing protein [Candidatus Pacebacteria bacterium]|jgi:protein-disulfide isomerase|nr:thioredoxin domain-containing protein [Candidatus Paceibacterota bacterium]